MNNKNIEIVPTEFEAFIIKCCSLSEWDLRAFLQEELGAAGFTIQKDDYQSWRPGKFKTITNMLAIRGESPSICLVAHTDVCRDHGVNPKIKYLLSPIVKARGNKRIIQDRYCKVQTGGDDRLGVAINTWIALNTGYDMGLLFTTDEEIGAISADYANFKELNDFEILVEVDRGNHSNQLVTSISGHRLCSPEVAQRLLRIAEQTGNPRTPVQGLLTDVLCIKKNNMCKNAVNMTCGYHNSYGSSANEFIDVKEAEETRNYVNEIIKNYELEHIEKINNQQIKPLIAETQYADLSQFDNKEWN